MLCFSTICLGQDKEAPSFLIPAQELNEKRVRLACWTGGTVFAASATALYSTWYRDFDRESFHFFDDWGEWNNMDKWGHSFTAYFQSEYSYQVIKWTGIDESKAALYGSLSGLLLQTTVEAFDAFSTKWGFSMYDMAFNVLGAGSFYAQQKLWGHQEFRFKMSTYYKSYNEDPLHSMDMQITSSLKERADQLYGHSWPERFLKDYNAQTIWLSFPLKRIAPIEQLPDWLNIAFGYSGEGLFGGYDNHWEYHGSSFYTDEKRYRQYMLSLDVDWSRVNTNKPWIKTLFMGMNLWKVPFPTVAYSSTGEWSVHLLYVN